MGWIIFGGIVLLIAAVLAAPAVITVEYSKELRLRIRLLFVTIVQIPPKTKKAAKKDKRAEKAAIDAATAEEKAAEEQADKSASADKAEKSAPESRADSAKAIAPKNGEKDGKLTLEEMFELAKALVDSLGKPLKKLLRRTRICKLRINITCGGDDAADAAMNFGKTNILVGNILGWTDTFFTLKKPDDIHIGADFQSEETLTEFSFSARLTVFAALAFALTALGRAVGNYRKKPIVQRAIRKMK